MMQAILKQTSDVTDRMLDDLLLWGRCASKTTVDGVEYVDPFSKEVQDALTKQER